PRVRIFSGASGQPLPGFGDFLAYDASFGGGVFVAVGDVNSDGKADVITGAGGAPHVKVLSGVGGSEMASFMAYVPTFAGGVRVATIEYGGRTMLITGAGPGGGPHVKLIDPLSLAEMDTFFAFDAWVRSGVFVAGGRIQIT